MRTPSILRCLPLLACTLGSPSAFALPPSNDDWANRIQILPAQLAAGFSDSQSTIAEATVDAGDPLLVCKNGDPQQRGNTVWYALDLTAVSAPVYLNAAAIGYDSVLAVFTGSPGSFVPATGACNDDGATSFAARFHGVRLLPGSNYSILVARPAQNTNVATLALTVGAAPQYIVSKVEDTLDGSCNADCSVREAVAASNVAPGAILLPAGSFTLTRTGSDNTNANGDLDLLSGAGIYGVGNGASGTRIVGVSGDRVFDLDPANQINIGATFNFADLAISGGGGIGPGAGINAANGNDHLALKNLLLENNSATLLPGGAVHSNGPSVVDTSTVRNNSSAGNGGGLAFAAANVLTRVDVFGSTIVGNQSTTSSSGGGGGIFSSGNLVVYNSTFSGNSARFSGGGILSTTFNGRVNLQQVTLAGNTADSDNNLSGSGGGLRAEGSGASSLNSAFAGNRSSSSGDDCSRAPALTFAAAAGNHLETTGTVTDCGFASGSNSSGPARLGALAPGIGPTATHVPLAGSPLIDLGDAANCLSVDQRGQPRPADGDLNGSSGCDIGAVELNAQEGDALFRDSFE